jgi:hypothetical protein
VGLRLGTGDVGGDDVDVVPAPAGLAGEEMDVLTNAAQVRIVSWVDSRSGRFGNAG